VILPTLFVLTADSVVSKFTKLVPLLRAVNDKVAGFSLNSALLPFR